MNSINVSITPPDSKHLVWCKKCNGTGKIKQVKIATGLEKVKTRYIVKEEDCDMCEGVGIYYEN